jgi:hypothetical protein
MDAGAEDASRRHVGDATILQLHVDDEPAFRLPARLTGYTSAASQLTVRCWKLVRWAWLTPLLVLVVCGLWFTIGSTPFDYSEQGVRTGDIERTVGFELSGQLLGDLRVNRVRCMRQSKTNARCVAELFDKGGDGPIIQRVTVSIEQDTGDYFWQPGPAR